MNNKSSVNINYTLIFQSAFHFGTGLRNGLIDRAIARTGDGYLYVPGSTIKGVLRHRCEQLAALYDLESNEPHTRESQRKEANTENPDIITRIFGSRFIPSTLFFDDALLIDEDQKLFDGNTVGDGKYKTRQIEERTQVSLSRRTRTAKPGHLFSSEYGIQSLRFRGQVYGYIEGIPILDEPQSYSLLILLTGLQSLNRVGGNKSTGAGNVICQIDDLVQYNGEKINLQSTLELLPMLDLYSEAREMEE